MDGIGSQLALRGEGVAGNKNSGDYEQRKSLMTLSLFFLNPFLLAYTLNPLAEGTSCLKDFIQILLGAVLYTAITQSLGFCPEVMSMLWIIRVFVLFYIPSYLTSHSMIKRSTARQTVLSKREVCIFYKCHFKKIQGQVQGERDRNILTLLQRQCQDKALGTNYMMRGISGQLDIGFV